MLLLIDECVPQSVIDVFAVRRHSIQFVVDVLGPKTPDPLVAAHAHKIGATLVTWNYKHFRPLISREHHQYDNAGLIAFYKCAEPNGAARLTELIRLIEYEAHCLRTGTDKRRLIAVIQASHLRIFR